MGFYFIESAFLLPCFCLTIKPIQNICCLNVMRNTLCIGNVQCRQLIPALNEWAPRPLYTPARPHARTPDCHAVSWTLQLNVSLIRKLRGSLVCLAFLIAVHGYVYNQALADVLSIGAGIWVTNLKHMHSVFKRSSYPQVGNRGIQISKMKCGKKINSEVNVSYFL